MNSQKSRLFQANKGRDFEHDSAQEPRAHASRITAQPPPVRPLILPVSAFPLSRFPLCQSSAPCCWFVATLLHLLLHLKCLPDNDVTDVAPFSSAINDVRSHDGFAHHVDKQR
jgi:hypothetical protein